MRFARMETLHPRTRPGSFRRSRRGDALPFSPIAKVPRTDPRQALAEAFGAVRGHSCTLAAPLSDEDQCVQSMPDASPAKWHLAHTTWFFETMVLQRFMPAYRPFDARYAFLFNSYYEALGPRHPRPARGLLTRPSGNEVRQYRSAIDDAIERLLHEVDGATLAEVEPVLTLGLHHEQQHQELLLTDALHLLSRNPVQPAFRPPTQAPIAPPPTPLRWSTRTGR